MTGTDIPELDPVIHAQARLRVVSALSVMREADRIAFPRLQETLRMTAGNTVIAMTPQFAGKTLAPGLYKFAFKAKDDQGNVSTKLSPRVLVTK